MSPRGRAPRTAAAPPGSGVPASLLRPRRVGLRRADDDRLVPHVVAHIDDALGHLRERARAGVLHEPPGAADGRGAVAALGAERALPVTPQLARFRLLR